MSDSPTPVQSEIDGSRFATIWNHLKPKEPKSTDNDKKVANIMQEPPNMAPSIHASRYDFNHSKRGKAIVFNHYKFLNGQSARDGARSDQDAVVREFGRLGFQVQVYTDLTRSKIMNKLTEVANEDHSEHDCLAVIVMTHGNPNELCAYDDTYDTSKLWRSFAADKCKSLSGKPKLFFIQACRGDDVDSGTRVTAAPDMGRRTETDGVMRATYVVPNMADILVAYATFDGYFAYRNKGGSWFIQKLCDELAEHGDHEEICLLLTHVNRKVAFEFTSYIPGNSRMNDKKQIPNFLSSLTRELYFTPKNATLIKK